jgi:hypothetical protein
MPSVTLREEPCCPACGGTLQFTYQRAEATPPTRVLQEAVGATGGELWRAELHCPACRWTKDLYFGQPPLRRPT